MTKAEIISFLKQGTQTAKVSTANKKNGTCHAVPVWFVLDGIITMMKRRGRRSRRHYFHYRK